MALKDYLLQNLNMDYKTNDSPFKRLMKRISGGYMLDNIDEKTNNYMLKKSINNSASSIPKTTGLDNTTPEPVTPPQIDVNYTGGSTNTPNTDIQYTANKLNELSYGSSPMDLFSLRQRLARDQALAAVGQLPGDNANNAVFDGMGITEGNPNYNYAQRMDVNKATADIYAPQINALDDLIKASSKSCDNELTISQKVNTFNKIVNEYNKSPLIRAAERTPVLSGTIDAVLKDPKNSALQLNLSYAYIQALDTYQSAVREGELSNLNSIDSKIGQIQNYVQKMGNGQIMRPEIAKQVAESAKSIVDLINTSAKQKAQSFRSQAQVSGIGEQWDQYTGGFNPVYNSTNNSSEEIITDGQGNRYRVNPDGSATQILSKVGGVTNSASNVSSLQDAMRRIARNESDGSGGYKAVGPKITNPKSQYYGQRAIGKYQVMQGNIGPWSKEILGYSVTPQQFYNNPQLQDKIVAGKMIQFYNDKTKGNGNWADVASVWFTGGPLAKNANKKDTFGTTGAQYVNKFLS